MIWNIAICCNAKRIYVTNPLVIGSTKWRASTKPYDWNTRKCKW